MELENLYQLYWIINNTKQHLDPETVLKEKKNCRILIDKYYSYRVMLTTCYEPSFEQWLYSDEIKT